MSIIYVIKYQTWGDSMEVTGTVINYYLHCQRQCWLFNHRINIEDNSDDVRMGRVLHEMENEGTRNSDVSIGNVRVDKITEEYLVEVKKSDADIEAARWQTLLYLKKLKEKGIERKGKIEFVEQNKQSRKVHYTELSLENEIKLDNMLTEIGDFLSKEMPPPCDNSPKCKKCAYYEYCVI